MNILSISVLAVVTVIICVMLKPKNAEISVMLGISCSVIILIGVLTQVSAIVTTINQIIASSGISTNTTVIITTLFFTSSPQLPASDNTVFKISE